jgi:uncharacterized membrane protein
MSKYDWLLFLHVTGAFLLLGGGVVAGALNFAALRRERPSEVAALLGLIRYAVFAIAGGALLTLVFGLWLVDASPYQYSYGSFWVIAALVLWLVGNVLGKLGGDREENARKLAEQLAAQGDAASAELRAAVRDRRALVMSYGSGLVLVLLLVDMIWKPGA